MTTLEAVTGVVGRRMGCRAHTLEEVKRIIREEFPSLDLADDGVRQVYDAVQREAAKVEGGAAITARALTALRETAQALRAAGHDREFVDASLTVTCHANYVGLINGVLDEVFPPQAMYDLCLVDKVDRLDVMAAVKVIAADWRAGARKARPTCGEDPCYGHDGDDEISEAVADAYDDVATTLLRAFGLPTEEV